MRDFFQRQPWAGWTLMGLGLLLFVLVPFFLWEDPLNDFTERLLEGRDRPWLTGGAVVLLLALDVVLPIPSSLVSTFAGYALGLLPGALASWLGLTLGCALGYGIGRLGGPALVRRVMGPGEQRRAEEAARSYGAAALALCRAVPVLAEASVIFAGLSRMPLGRFVAVTALSNLGVSLVYAFIGQSAADVESFLLAFLGSLLVPLLAMGAARALSGASSSTKEAEHEP